MSSDRELTHIVRSWLEEGVDALPDRVVDDVLAQLPVTPQRRPLWRAWRTRLMNSTVRFAAAGAVVLVVAVVGLAIYFSPPAVTPVGSSSPTETPTVALATPTEQAVTMPTDSPTSTPAITAQPTQTGSNAPWVVFLRGDGRFGTPDDVWAMRADGSDAHEILPGVLFPNIVWSQDGRRLLVSDGDEAGGHIYLSEVSDVIGPFVDTGFDTGADTACNEKSRKPFPCQDFGFSFAPDGERVVVLQACTYVIPGCAFLTIIDVTTGERTELSETLQKGPGRGQMGDPAWSPDGSMIAFVQEIPSTDVDVVSEMKLFIINADGTNLHQVDLTVPRVKQPQWSPNGTTLVLLSDIYGEQGGETTFAQDVYTVHPDGTGLLQLTNNGQSLTPEWTLSNQIRFRNGNESQPTLTFSLMDADGGNLRPYADMEPLIRALTTSGTTGEYSIPGYPGQSFFWQPAESWQSDL